MRNDQVISTDTTANDKQRHTNKYFMIFITHLYRKTRLLCYASILQSLQWKGLNLEFINFPFSLQTSISEDRVFLNCVT